MLCSQDQWRGRVRGTRFNFMTCSATACMFFMYIMTKINFCYHATVQAIWFSIVWLIDNSSSRTCLNIAQCTIGIGLRFYILVLSVSGAVFFSYNFTIFVQFLISRCKLCLFFFIVSLCFLVTNWFYSKFLISRCKLCLFFFIVSLCFLVTNWFYSKFY